MLTALPAQPKILDVGCGPGAQTLDLARMSTGDITAVDNHLPFLEKLSETVQHANLASRIETREADMFRLPFKKELFDVIWSEGAIYNLGFENGLKTLGAFLKPGGYIAVSEAVWLRDDPPPELKTNWDEEYPAMTTIAANVDKVKSCGYELLGHFTLPKSSWLDDFYTPMEKRIHKIKTKYKHDQEIIGMMPYFENEIEVYKKYFDYFSYEFFVMRKQ